MLILLRGYKGERLVSLFLFVCLFVCVVKLILFYFHFLLFYSLLTISPQKIPPLDIVILTLALLNKQKIAQELDFLYQLNRLNVGVSRAKRLCIVLMGGGMLVGGGGGGGGLLLVEGQRRGFVYLKELVERSEKMVCMVGRREEEKEGREFMWEGGKRWGELK